MKRDSLRRRPSYREPRARFLIVCEGEVTEPHYFRELRRSERGIIDLEIVPAGTPKTVVEEAVRMKKASEREARRLSDENQRYDFVWCVFDIDDHPLVSEAKQQAKSNAIELAISNPCFELWLLLHFQEQTAPIARQNLRRLCRERMPEYGKRPPCDALTPRTTDAIERARRLDQWHRSRDTEGANPSTGVYRLVQQILAACSR